jgi:ribonuclease HI
MTDGAAVMRQAVRMHPALFDGPGLFDLPDATPANEPAAGPVAARPAASTPVPPSHHLTETAPASTRDNRPALAPSSGVDIGTAILLATDGSCLRNPGGATGWAYVRSDGVWASAGCPEGTNQIGELQAVVLALSHHPDVPVEIQCDSSYAIGCATAWKKGWQRNNYVNSQRKTVSNLEIIRELHRLIDARTAPLTFTKVKGHDASNKWPLNTAVDVLCGEAALATLQAKAPVSNSGVLEIDWAGRTSRGSAR